MFKVDAVIHYKAFGVATDDNKCATKWQSSCIGISVMLLTMTHLRVVKKKPRITFVHRSDLLWTKTTGKLDLFIRVPQMTKKLLTVGLDSGEE